MHAHLLLRGPRGQSHTLGPGDIIGRNWCASLHIDDPRVSEAHALLSLRGDKLRLLSLRGRFLVDGRPQTDVALAVGMRIAFAPGVDYEVIDLSVPEAVLALRSAGMADTALHGAAAIVLRPDPQLVHPTTEGVSIWIWPVDRGARLRRGTDDPQDLQPGDSFVIDGRTFQLVLVATSPSAPTAERSTVQQPLRIVARYETVHIHRRGGSPLVLDGVQARLVSELVAFGVPVPWRALAGELWPELDDNSLLRKRLDGAIARLRTTLADGGVRTDLVRNNGQGQFELLLDAADSVDDQM